MSDPAPTPLPQPGDHDRRRSAVALAILRIWCGLWFLIIAQPKLPLEGVARWTFPAQFQESVTYFLEWGALDFYQPVLEVVVKHPRTVSAVLVFTEASLGGLLILGFFTRTSATVGLIVGINYLFATSRLHRAYVGLNLWILMCLILVLLGRAGRQYGIDGFFGKEGSG